MYAHGHMPYTFYTLICYTRTKYKPQSHVLSGFPISDIDCQHQLNMLANFGFSKFTPCNGTVAAQILAPGMARKRQSADSQWTPLPEEVIDRHYSRASYFIMTVLSRYHPSTQGLCPWTLQQSPWRAKSAHMTQKQNILRMHAQILLLFDVQKRQNHQTALQDVHVINRIEL